MAEQNNRVFRLFGFEINRVNNTDQDPKVKSIVPPADESGEGYLTASGSYFGQYVNLDGVQANNVSALVRQYRVAASEPEVDDAIENIITEAISTSENDKSVELILDNVDTSESIKKKILEEFDYIYRLLNFNEYGYDIFKRWYVDGRIYHHLLVKEGQEKRGIIDIRPIDAAKMYKHRRVKEKIDPKTGAKIVDNVEEYFVYQEMVGNMQSTVKFTPDSISYVTSGLLNEDRKYVVSYLHKALKPINQLRMMEDSLVIYRLARAPERRIFYIDVGNLPRGKAEEYMKDIMSRYRNKIVYDAETGNLKDDRKHMSMLEDFWLPRREGGRGTEISTLPSGCLAMDTMVPLLDGRELSIRNIADEMDTGKTLWTYSTNPETGAIVPGLISWAGVTQESATVMRLTLDNGEQITCTPDHKFPVWDKGFVEAKDLSENDSIIPFNKRNKDIVKNSGTRKDYEQIFDNETKKWVYTHRMVRDTLELPEWVYIQENSDLWKDVVHHVDHNRFNNSPENLVMMSWNDHKKYHSDHAAFPEYAASLGGQAAAKKLREMKINDPEAYKDRCKKQSEMMKESWLDSDFIDSVSKGTKAYWNNLSNEERNKRAEISKNNGAKGNDKLKELLKDSDYREWYCEVRRSAWTDEKRQKQSEITKARNREVWNDEILGEELRKNHAEKQKLVFDYEILLFIIDMVKGKTTHEFTLVDVVNELNNSERMLHLLRDKNKHKNVPNWNEGFTPTIVNKIIRAYGYSDGWKAFRKSCNLQNHRVVKVEYLDDKIEVGTLTIDHDHLVHDHHTFALSVGIFTKNSNLGEIDDILYFQRRVYNALNVPVTRMSAEENPFQFGRTTEVSREEIQFQKFIDRLRSRFSQLFLGILKKQLILKNIITEQDWNDFYPYMRVDYARDNYFTELKEAEILRERMQTMEVMRDYIGTYFSREWAMRNVLRMNDQDIDTEIKRLEKEQEQQPEQPDEEE